MWEVTDQVIKNSQAFKSDKPYLIDLRRVKAELLRSTLSHLHPLSALVVTASQASVAKDLNSFVWPMPLGSESWQVEYEQGCLQVLQHRLGMSGWQVRDESGKLESHSNDNDKLGSQPPILAIASPLPPERSGISDYVSALLPALSHYYRLVLIHPAANTLDPFWDGAGKRIPVQPPSWLANNGQSSLRILYHFGNSHFHEWMVDLIQHHPGIVVLHDYYLAHLICFWASQQKKPMLVSRLFRECHGLPALKHYMDESARHGDGHLWSYSLNSPILKAATGVLVHSEHSKQLARKEYANESLLHWHKLPYHATLLPPASDQEKHRIYNQFRLQSDQNIICSFGYIGPSKLSLKLLESFALSKLGDQGWVLVFVGSEGGNSAFRRRLDAAIQSKKLNHCVIITGWTDTEDYACFHKLSSISVQLRTQSRGETSAAVMDCLQSGAALIVNRHGSLDELPDDVCSKLPDHFSTDELADELNRLASHPEARATLGQHARAYCSVNLSPQACSKAYQQAIEAIWLNSSHRLNVAKRLGSQHAYQHFDRSQRLRIINGLAERLPALPRPRRLFVDVSSIIHHDLGTGIQRVIKNLCLEFFRQLPAGWQLEPISAQSNKTGYQSAPSFASQLLGLSDLTLTDSAPVLPCAGDIFLGLDLVHSIVHEHASWYDLIQARGARTWFVVYDLLPCLMPEYFPPGTEKMHALWLKTITRANGAVCISRTVSEELRKWIDTHGESTCEVRWFHQGADLPVCNAEAVEISSDLRDFSPELELLMVGTIEPRKGYLEVLQAMQNLWENELPIALTIVGKEGWQSLPADQRRTIPDTIALLNRLSAQFPNRLRWLNSVNDDELMTHYQRATALLAASYGEGFGLPLVEARHFGLKVIARDIPVFREVLGDDGLFFTSASPQELAFFLGEWYKASRLDPSKRAAVYTHHATRTTPPTSWQESCSQLLRALAIQPPHFQGGAV